MNDVSNSFLEFLNGGESMTEKDRSMNDEPSNNKRPAERKSTEENGAKRVRNKDAEKPVKCENAEAPASKSEDDAPLIPQCKAIIIEDLIAVDTFRKKDRVKYHFLTHAHADHTRGLGFNWDRTIYCSRETAKILPLLTLKDKANFDLNDSKRKDGVFPPHIRSLKMGRNKLEPGLEVTLLDANHVVGAVMYLFEGELLPDGPILCTGDFRADDHLIHLFKTHPDFRRLATLNLSKVYLDNTYYADERVFPTRSQVADQLAKLIKRNKEHDILIKANYLGREGLLIHLARHTQEKISLGTFRLAVMKVMHSTSIDALKKDADRHRHSSRPIRSQILLEEIFAETSSKCRIKIRDRFTLRSEYEESRSKTEKIFVVELSARSDLVKSYNEETYRNLCYSEHSSREEIRQFLCRLSYDEIIPTSAPMTAKDMKSLFGLKKPQDEDVESLMELKMETDDQEDLRSRADPPVNVSPLREVEKENQAPAEVLEAPLRLVKKEPQETRDRQVENPQPAETEVAIVAEKEKTIVLEEQETVVEKENEASIDWSFMDRHWAKQEAKRRPYKPIEIGGVDVDAMCPPLKWIKYKPSKAEQKK